MKFRYKIGLVCYTSWCTLGFVRGVNSHIYNHNKYNPEKPVIYSHSVTYGLFGIIMYANPVFFPIVIHKEFYRIEVNVRNLENEKKNNYYNNLM